MGKMYLIKFSSDWADEFTMEGYNICNEKMFNNFMNGIEKAEYPHEDYFGTNENFEFYSKEYLLRRLTIKEITEEEAITIKNLLGDDLGYVPNCYDWLSYDD